MCYVCCKELKGWCKSFTRTEGLLSILEAILLVVFFSFFIFLILHFVACRPYPEVITEKPPKITSEATISTSVADTTTVETTAADSSSGRTSTLSPDVECTWEPSRQTSAATHYYLDIDTRTLPGHTETPSKYTQDEVTTENNLEIFNSTLEPPHDYDDVEFLEPINGEPADDTYKNQVVALVKLNPLGDVTFGCILTKITKFWTLTAASCIESIEEVDSLDSFVIMEQFGEAAASRPRSVADVRVHPRYRGAAGRSRPHDLAALRAHRALRPAAPRLPALLDYFRVALGERFHILGYGGYRTSTAGRRLRQVWVFWLAGGACGAAGTRHLARAGAARHGACGAGAVCAGARWARGAACGYCAGTPLLRAGTLFGVMSDGGDCGVTCEPQLFVNVATLRDWIDAVTID